MRRFWVVLFVIVIIQGCLHNEPEMKDQGIGELDENVIDGLPNVYDDASSIRNFLLSMEGHFVENVGQVREPGVRYYAEGDPLSVGLLDDGVLFSLYSSEGTGAAFGVERQVIDAPEFDEVPVELRSVFGQVQPPEADAFADRLRFLAGRDKPDAHRIQIREFVVPERRLGNGQLQCDRHRLAGGDLNALAHPRDTLARRAFQNDFQLA